MKKSMKNMWNRQQIQQFCAPRHRRANIISRNHVKPSSYVCVHLVRVAAVWTDGTQLVRVYTRHGWTCFAAESSVFGIEQTLANQLKLLLETCEVKVCRLLARPRKLYIAIIILSMVFISCKTNHTKLTKLPDTKKSEEYRYNENKIKYKKTQHYN